MSDLVTGKESPNFRVLSGPPAIVEHQLNELLTDYTAVIWHWATIKDELIVSAVLMHNRIIRQQQLAARGIAGVR